MCSFQDNWIKIASSSNIHLSKYNSPEKDVTVLFDQVLNLNASWVLHDLNLVMINCSLGDLDLYVVKNSRAQFGTVDIERCNIFAFRVLGEYQVNIRNSYILHYEAKNSVLLLTGYLLESKLEANNSSVRIDGNISQGNDGNSSDIQLANYSNLLITNATFGRDTNILSVFAEQSNVSLQNSALSNVQLTDVSKSNNVLSIKNSTFYNGDHLPYSRKTCAFCIKGIETIVISNSKFVIDGDRGYGTIFDISNVRNINIMNSVFETEKETHFQVSNSKYTFSVDGSIFKKETVTLSSDQPEFVNNAKANGIIGNIPNSTKTLQDTHSDNFVTYFASFMSLFVVIFVSMAFVCAYYRRRKQELPKRMREFDAILCYSRTTDGNLADTILNEMEEKYHLKLFFKDRDYMLGRLIIKNIQEAVEKSNHAIVVLSVGFLECFFCRQMLWACLIEQQRDPSFQLSIILAQQKRIILRNINTFLRENRTQVVYEQHLNMFEKLFTKLKTENYSFGDDLFFIQQSHEKSALFAKMASFVSKNKFLDADDPQLYNKLLSNMKKNRVSKCEMRQPEYTERLDERTSEDPGQDIAEENDETTPILENDTNCHMSLHPRLVTEIFFYGHFSVEGSLCCKLYRQYHEFLKKQKEFCP